MSSLKDLASLIMIPSLVKDGRLDTVKPLGNSIIHPDATGNNDGTDGSTPAEGNFTFSRGSNLAATRVDVNGLIEKGRENVLLQSNQFDTNWATSNASVTSGQSGYDGSSDAWLLQASGTFAFVRQLGLSVNGVATASVYLKAGTTDWVNFRLSASANNQIYVNLSNGTFGTISAANLIDKSIEGIGNGWYRVSVVLNVSSLTGFYIYVADGDNTLNTTNETIYIQDAQLESSLVATPYISTGASTAQAGILEDLPRLDYSGGASCPSLLLEPQRTNTITDSESFTFGNWQPVRVAVTNNYGISPDGTQNSTKLVFEGSNDYINRATLGSGIETSSIYIKGIQGETIKFGKGGNVASGQNHTLTGDWQRLIVVTEDAGTAFHISTFGGVTAREVEVFGAMQESGSYPTSYIPTYGSAVTRSGDVCLKTSISDLIGQTEGTLFFDWIMNHESPNTSEDLYTLILSDGSGNKLIGVNNYNNTLAVFIKNTTTQFFDNSYTSGADGARIKLALAYANNDIALYINGAQIATDSSATIPTLSQVRLNTFWNGNLPDNSSVNQLLLFKTRLTNAELAALTA